MDQVAVCSYKNSIIAASCTG